MPRPREDARVWAWFESVSMPTEEVCTRVLNELSTTSAMSLSRLEVAVNMGRSRLSTLLSILDVQGAVRRVKGGYVRTDAPWEYDGELAERLRMLRANEAEQMRAFSAHDGCRLRYLRDLLDDAEASDCGRCDRCIAAAGGAERFSAIAPPSAVEARDYLRGGDVGVEPRRQWAPNLDEPKGKIKPERQAQSGRALSRRGDGGWGPEVNGLLDGSITQLSPELINGIVGVLKRWDWQTRPVWVCPMPSRRNSLVINAIAVEIGRLGKLPVHAALVHDGAGGFQADQDNSAFQLANVWGRLSVDFDELPDESMLTEPVLLVDDSADSRWSLTVAAFVLQDSGTGPVLPFVLQSR